MTNCDIKLQVFIATGDAERGKMKCEEDIPRHQVKRSEKNFSDVIQPQ